MTDSATNSLRPYLAGAGIGALQWFTLATANKTLGVTTPFESTAAAIELRAKPGSHSMRRYLQQGGKEPSLDWEWMLVAGIPLGAFLAARAENMRRPDYVPKLWRRRFGGSAILRTAGAFTGGLFMMAGARMAKGCTSGHCLSGTAKLSVASWLFSAVMGFTALAVTRTVFGATR